MEKGADISADGLYRYALWWIWEPLKPLVMFIGLNLSRADATRDDIPLALFLLLKQLELWRFGDDQFMCSAGN